MMGRLLALAVLLATTAGCATKRDLRDLRDEMAASGAAQEQILRDLQRQTAAILDSISTQDVRLRGDLANRLLQIDRQLVQIQELTGQGQQQLSQLREAVRTREEVSYPFPDGTAAPDGDAQELFDAASAALQRGSLSTARAGFEELARRFPNDPLAADALFGIGQARGEAGEMDQAIDAYTRVLELHPNHPRAPTSLLNIALLEAEDGDTERARAMLSQLIAAYPDSPEADRAAQELQRLRR